MLPDDTPTQRATPEDQATVRGLAAEKKVFNRYRLIRVLGRGGMGVVWLAHDLELEREVALKFLPEMVALDPQSVLDLKRETRRSLDLTYPNIIRIYDFAQDGQTAAISMEYVAGETLATLKVREPNRSFTPRQLTPWVSQLCAALDYAHRKAEVVHRDLKPANLMIDARGDLKVADFGIAASVSDSISRVSMRMGSSGTPCYMSPQQMMGEKPAVTDDIYALGATLYDLLTGKPPFYSGNVMAQVQGKVAPTISERRREFEYDDSALPEPFITPDWEQTIAACLAKDSADRPQSMTEVARRLGVPAAGAAESGLRGGVPGAPVPPAGRQTRGAKRPVPAVAAASGGAGGAAPRWGRRLVLATAVLVLLAAAGYFGAVVLPARARLAAEQLQAEQARQLAGQRLAEQREAARKAAAAAAEQASRAAAELKLRTAALEDKAYQQVDQVILALSESAPPADYEAAHQSVNAYLASAPERYRAPVTAAWQRHEEAWHDYEAAHRPGTLRVETDPPGATVILYPGNIRRTSPAVFANVPPGTLSFRVESEGYEAQDLSLDLKPGGEARAGLVRLVSLTGSATLTSDPSGARVSLDGNSRHFEGVTPFQQDQVPPGTYQATWQRADWPPVRQTLEIRRNGNTALAADLHGEELAIRSDPPGAAVTLNGKPAGFTPLILPDQAPVDYQVGLTLDGYDPATRTLIAGTQLPVNVVLARTVAKTATLVIMRPSHFIGSLGRLDIRINGQTRGDIGNGSCWVIELPVGEYDVGLKTLGASVRLTHVVIEPGKIIYLQSFIGMTAFYLQPVSEETARQLLPRLALDQSSPSNLGPLGSRRW